LCRTNAGHNALPDKFALELGECREDMQQEPGGGVTFVGVDVLRDRDEPNAQRGQRSSRPIRSCP
jgi:hypothetical protein